jgi:BirA family biotin operon repressor/biotin-[acetyl-CoA-carboxylase] ligase
VIKKIIRFKAVASTQDTARRFINEKEEMAIASYRQTRGRGRVSRTWFSPSGGMYLSFLLFPETRISSIPLLASLTIVRVLEQYGFSGIEILWPNDVLLRGQKVCGIICEQYKKSIICGIGLNVNILDFAQGVTNATSLRIESGKEYDIDELIENVVGIFNPLYGELQSKGLKVKEVLNYIKGIGESVEIVTNKDHVRGTVFDIDEDWALLLRDDSGIIRKFYYGDVRKLRW